MLLVFELWTKKYVWYCWHIKLFTHTWIRHKSDLVHDQSYRLSILHTTSYKAINISNGAEKLLLIHYEELCYESAVKLLSYSFLLFWFWKIIVDNDKKKWSFSRLFSAAAEKVAETAAAAEKAAAGIKKKSANNSGKSSLAPASSHSVVEAFFPFIKRGVDSPNFALLFSD